MIRVVSLFCGAGGLDYGFHKNKAFDVVFSNDFNKDACSTYRHNFNANILREGDVASFIDEIPQHDILIGGFSCQPFTLAGKRQGFDDDTPTSATLNRGLQYKNCVAVLEKCQPAYFIFENVKGLLSHMTGDRSTLSIIKDDMIACGYRMTHTLVTMTDYGVPQRRQRVFLLGARSDLSTDPISLLPPKPTVTKSLLLKDNLPFGDNFTSFVNHNEHTGTAIKRKWMSILNEGENLNNIPQEEVNLRLSNNNYPHETKPRSILGYRKLNGNEIAPTMMFGNSCIPIHPYSNRSLSVREAAYLQGFPKDFQFFGGTSAQYKQVGNAVPPAFSSHLASNIADFVEFCCLVP